MHMFSNRLYNKKKPIFVSIIKIGRLTPFSCACKVILKTELVDICVGIGGSAQRERERGCACNSFYLTNSGNQLRSPSNYFPSELTYSCIRCCQCSKQFRRLCSVRLLRISAVFAFTFYQQYQDYKMCRHCYVAGVCTK
jgi:hypothetical protein